MSRSPVILPVRKKNSIANKSKTIRGLEDDFCKQMHEKLEDGFKIKDGLVYYAVNKPTLFPYRQG